MYMYLYFVSLFPSFFPFDIRSGNDFHITTVSLLRPLLIISPLPVLSAKQLVLHRWRKGFSLQSDITHHG